MENSVNGAGRINDGRRKSVKYERRKSVAEIELLNTSNLRRKSIVDKSVNILVFEESERGEFGSIWVDDDITDIQGNSKNAIGTLSKNEVGGGTKGIQRLLSFENRNIPREEESDDESITSIQSYHSLHQEKLIDSQVNSFTGELLKRTQSLVSNIDEKEETKIIIEDCSPNANLNVDSANNSYLDPNITYSRRPSFAANLLNPSVVEEIKINKTRSKLILPSQKDTKEKEPKDEKLTNNNHNLSPSLRIHQNLPLPKIKDSKLLSPRDSTAKTIDIWKKLKEDSKGAQQDVSTVTSKFSQLGEIVSTVKDLKRLGLDPNIIVKFNDLKI